MLFSTFIWMFQCFKLTVIFTDMLLHVKPHLHQDQSFLELVNSFNSLLCNTTDNVDRQLFLVVLSVCFLSTTMSVGGYTLTLIGTPAQTVARFSSVLFGDVMTKNS